MKKHIFFAGMSVFLASVIIPPVPAFADCTTSFSLGSSNIRVGSRGESVRGMQSALNTILGESLVLDGVYGPKTKQTVMKMQTTIGTKADGVVGPQTALKINEFLKTKCGTEGTLTKPETTYTHSVKSFGTKKEAEAFLKDKVKNTALVRNFGPEVMMAADTAGAPVAKTTSAGSSSNFSQTNIQEAGVDESDIVKTDGKYIYTLSGKSIDITSAGSNGELEKIKTISLSGDAHDMYLSDGRLAVMMYAYEEKQYQNPKVSADTQVSSDFRPGTYSVSFLRTTIYNITDPMNPKLERTYDIEGSYMDSRIIDGHLYLISQKYLYNNTCCTIMPMVKENGRSLNISAPVYYFDMPYRDYAITQVHSINLKDSKSIKESNFLLSGGHMLYASDKALYLSYTDYQYPEVQPMVDDAPMVKMAILPTGQERTVIHKIDINKGSAKLSGTGFVPGSAINQFAFSEHNGNLRVATTVGNNWNGTKSTNNMYVLDSGMKIIGKLEGLAPEERIYSVRFMEDRAYMVTFKQVDPLFVIDLATPTAPKVLGKLKIPGFSSYLHPYSENLLIGIGQDTKTIGGRTTTNGVKISLFDVSNVARPREVDNLVLGGAQSSSEALYNHKAVLFSKEKNLLVIPFQEYNYEKPNEQFMGAVVLSINEKDISLRGKITHEDNKTWESAINRSLYIGEYLYTLSQKFLQSNALDSLKTVDSVELSIPKTTYPVYPIEPMPLVGATLR